jgi:hypothetical protein
MFWPLFSTIIGSAGVFSLAQFLISRHDRKKDDLDSIKKELKSIKAGQDTINTKVTRMELMNLIKEDSNNIDSILQVAEYYFIELDGNAYAHSMFEQWAKAHGVAIGWLPKITKGVKNGKKKAKD